MRDYYSEGVDLLEDYHFAMDAGNSNRRYEIVEQLMALNIMQDFDLRLEETLMEAFKS